MVSGAFKTHREDHGHLDKSPSFYRWRNPGLRCVGWGWCPGLSTPCPVLFLLSYWRTWISNIQKKTYKWQKHIRKAYIECKLKPEDTIFHWTNWQRYKFITRIWGFFCFFFAFFVFFVFVWFVFFYVRLRGNGPWSTQLTGAWNFTNRDPFLWLKMLSHLQHEKRCKCYALPIIYTSKKMSASAPLLRTGFSWGKGRESNVCRF